MWTGGLKGEYFNGMYILEVYFAKKEFRLPGTARDNLRSYLLYPEKWPYDGRLYRKEPTGSAICVWAVEWVVWGGQKLLCFGPYNSIKECKKLYEKLSKTFDLLGYRIYTECEFPYFHKAIVVDGSIEYCDGYPSYMWTDG